MKSSGCLNILGILYLRYEANTPVYNYLLSDDEDAGFSFSKSRTQIEKTSRGKIWAWHIKFEMKKWKARSVTR